ncbi:MAG: hypothetical protein AAFQ54_03435 [Pseudomonadota bacterium]
MRLLALWVATAGALLGWSEYVFVNEGPAQAALAPGWPGQVLAMWGFYLIPAAAFLALARLRALTHWWQAVLAGGIVGWVTEGVVVPAVYEGPPVSFVWTSLAWHAPVDVMLGLWLLPRLLRADRPSWALPALLLPAGLAAGTWALWTTGDGAEALNMTLGDFARLCLIYTPLVALGALAWAAWERQVAHLPAWAAWGALAACAAIGLVQGLAFPLFLAALAVIVALVLWLFLRAAAGPRDHAAAAPVRALWFGGFGISSIVAYALWGGAEAAMDQEILILAAFSSGTLIFLAACWRGFTLR